MEKCLQFVIFLAVLLIIVQVHSKDDSRPHKVVLIALDGFRWDYLNGRAKNPTFDLLKKNGVHARKGIQSVYITNTIPNHYSLATGLYVESHGMVDNIMLDTKTNEKYTAVFYDANVVNPDWLEKDVEPIWVSNQVQKKGKSGLLMWFGGETPVRSILPEKFVQYNEEMDVITKIDLLIDWMTDKTNPIDLALVHFPEPDLSAHLYGPESDQVTREIEKLDEAFNHFTHKLEQYGLSDTTDVIVTSDHGFVSVSPQKSFQVDDILNPEWYRCPNTLPGPVMAIYPNEGKHDVVFNKLKDSADATGFFQVFRSRDIPERFHYKSHTKVAPIFATASLGYSFVTKKKTHDLQKLNGNHGYDHEFLEMRPFFLAFGPSFKKGFSVETFKNVDIYPLMCHIKGINPAPNNGTMETVSKLLRHYNSNQSVDQMISPLTLVVGLGLLLLLLVAIFVHHLIQRGHRITKSE